MHFNKSCNHISKDLKSWEAAWRKCRELGGHLLKIDDQAEQNYFKNEVKNMTGFGRKNRMIVNDLILYKKTNIKHLLDS